VTSHTDVMPTLLAAAGFDLDPALYSDGVSLLGADQPRTALAMQFDVEEPSDYALIDASALLRFNLKRGKIRLTGAEWVDPARPGEADALRSDPAVWQRLLAQLHHVTRWWRVGAATR
jgi:hypothetical protein